MTVLRFSASNEKACRPQGFYLVSEPMAATPLVNFFFRRRFPVDFISTGAFKRPDPFTSFSSKCALYTGFKRSSSPEKPSIRSVYGVCGPGYILSKQVHQGPRTTRLRCDSMRDLFPRWVNSPNCGPTYQRTSSRAAPPPK